MHDAWIIWDVKYFGAVVGVVLPVSDDSADQGAGAGNLPDHDERADRQVLVERADGVDGGEAHRAVPSGRRAVAWAWEAARPG